VFNKKKQPPIKSLIAEGSQIDGNFRFADGLRIDGAVVGNISGNPDLASILVISETASVTGEIQADHIIINGTVKGPVHARHARVAAQGPHYGGCALHGTGDASGGYHRRAIAPHRQWRGHGQRGKAHTEISGK